MPSPGPLTSAKSPAPGPLATPVSKLEISGLPVQKVNGFPFSSDIHMNTARGLTTLGLPDIRMVTAKGVNLNDDVTMMTARGGATTVKQGGFQLWEKELLESSEVKRKATVAQLCESMPLVCVKLPCRTCAVHIAGHICADIEFLTSYPGKCRCDIFH
jgi:hypothetical protein